MRFLEKRPGPLAVGPPSGSERARRSRGPEHPAQSRLCLRAGGELAAGWGPLPGPSRPPPSHAAGISSRALLNPLCRLLGLASLGLLYGGDAPPLLLVLLERLPECQVHRPHTALSLLPRGEAGVDPAEVPGHTERV